MTHSRGRWVCLKGKRSQAWQPVGHGRAGLQCGTSEEETLEGCLGQEGCARCVRWLLVTVDLGPVPLSLCPCSR